MAVREAGVGGRRPDQQRQDRAASGQVQCPGHADRRAACRIGRLALLGLLALALWLAPAWPAAAHTCVPDAEVDLDGALLVPSGSNLALITLPDRRARRLPVLPGGLIDNIVRSPDGGRLALSRRFQPEGHPVSGSDILVTAIQGGPPQVTIARERPGDVLTAPAWLPDGGLIYEHGRIEGYEAGVRLERVDAAGAARETVEEGGASPAVAPGGSRLAYIQKGGVDRLVIRPIEGGPGQVLVADPGFLGLAYPRFSPDGAWLAFAAVGSPTASRGGRPDARLLPALHPAAARPGVALAHGAPWDIWLIRPDGSDLRRLTAFYDDDPAPAWSPDGRWIAVFSGEALHVVAVDGPANYCVRESGGYGGIEWLP